MGAAECQEMGCLTRSRLPIFPPWASVFSSDQGGVAQRTIPKESFLCCLLFSESVKCPTLLSPAYDKKPAACTVFLLQREK